MKLHEYDARAILARRGVPFPPGGVASTADEAEDIARELGGKVVVKAQVLVGGRGKAGGVRVCASADEAREHAGALLGRRIKGSRVSKVLVTKAVEVSREFYLGAVLDRARRTVTVIGSGRGGVNIEQVAAEFPEAVVQIPADPLVGFHLYQGRDLALRIGVSREYTRSFASIARALYEAFVQCDCTLAEINPLAQTPEGSFLALDSKMVIDENALFRQPSLAALRDTREEPLAEVRAREVGVHFVKLDGHIGCLVNGAGLAMATMDAIKVYGGEPANFLDIGGGASEEQVLEALKLLMSDRKVRAVFVNVFGGITRCDTVAQALVDCYACCEISVPVVVRLTGTNEQEARALLTDTPVVLAESMAEGAKLAVSLAERQEEGAA
ncbi:MAG: ADP-forming succinate--CoA ligase subunit beta [Thermoleophilia bacterium]|nr:ADP-forming succinate--CoA ligase subunit beta [Thermoleophilia bacterium]